MADERANLPSASSFTITFCCPGSEQLIRQIENEHRIVIDLPNGEPVPKGAVIIDLPDEQQERGIRIHHAWETSDTSQLSDDELEDLNRTKELSDQVIENWLPEGGAIGQTYRERRLWLNDADTLAPLLSGQPDLVLVSGERALVQDLKSGFCQNLSPSEQSWQLRVLAVLVAKEHGVKSVRVVFVKPKFFNHAIDVTDYGPDHLVRAESQILSALWAAQQPNAQRVPGDHCTYCRGKPYCREAAAFSLLPIPVVDIPPAVAVTPEGAAGLVARMTAQDLAFVQRRKRSIANILEAVTARLKKMPAEELSAVGLKIGEGRKLDPVVRVMEAVTTLINLKIPYADVWACLSMSKGEIVKAVMQARGCTKKAAEEWLWKDVLAAYIEPRRSEGVIEEVEK